jgi:hypothetical protein
VLGQARLNHATKRKTQRALSHVAQKALLATTSFFPDIYERMTFDREELPADHGQEVIGSMTQLTD